MIDAIRNSVIVVRHWLSSLNVLARVLFFFWAVMVVTDLVAGHTGDALFDVGLAFVVFRLGPRGLLYRGGSA